VHQQGRAGMGSWSRVSVPGIVGAAGDLEGVNRGAHLEDIVVETSDFVFVGVDTRQHVAQGGLQTLHRRLYLCAVAEVDERASLGLSSQSFFICVGLFGPKRQFGIPARVGRIGQRRLTFRVDFCREIGAQGVA